MQQHEKPQFVSLIADVLGYYGKDASPFVIAIWWDACQNLAFEQVAKAMNTHVKDPERGQYPPKVSDIVRVLQGTTTDRAALAWGKVLEAMSSVGAYTDVVFDDPAIHAAIEDLGGWPKLCRTETKELSYLQHRFCLSHKAYTERGTFDFSKRLSGDRSPDDEYTKAGLPLPKPALIGDREKAKAVYLAGGAGKTKITFASIDKLTNEVRQIK
jgi:hypothetical protein